MDILCKSLIDHTLGTDMGFPDTLVFPHTLSTHGILPAGKVQGRARGEKFELRSKTSSQGPDGHLRGYRPMRDNV